MIIKFILRSSIVISVEILCIVFNWQEKTFPYNWLNYSFSVIAVKCIFGLKIVGLRTKNPYVYKSKKIRDSVKTSKRIRRD